MMIDDLYSGDTNVRSDPGEAGPADPPGAGAGAAASAPGPASASEESRRSLERAFEKAEFAPFGEKPRQGGHSNIDLLLDVPLPITVELGRTSMTIRDILDLGPGSVVELDRVAGEPVDILVNGKLVARGEVVVIDENFGVRVVDIVAPAERLSSPKS
ncbi:MAG: flagellar motor switch protein FliN [Bacillota bacterium]|nr:flagellar motor switch protein FliN [Bacillota bacterium]